MEKVGTACRFLSLTLNTHTTKSPPFSVLCAMFHRGSTFFAPKQPRAIDPPLRGVNAGGGAATRPAQFCSLRRRHS
eukprot:4150455-Amphidinium_carterae.2